MLTLYKALNILFDIIEIFIVIRMFLSFLPMADNAITRFIYEMTEPILSPCRELLRKLGLETGFVDFSPLVAVILLRIISYVLYIIIF